MATVLTEDSAHLLTKKINNSVTPYGALYEAWQYSIWRALGYPSWEAYCNAELESKAPAEYGSVKGTDYIVHRGTTARKLREMGMPTTAIAAAYHVHPSSISTQLDGKRGRGRHKPVDPRETARRAERDITDGDPVARRRNRKPLVDVLRRPIQGVSTGTRAIGRAMADQPEALRANRETLRNLYLTELRLASKQIDAAITALEK